MTFHVAIIGDAGKVWGWSCRFLRPGYGKASLAYRAQRHRQHFRGQPGIHPRRAGNDARLIVITIQE